MAIQWKYEACDLKPDPVSGAKISALTTSPRVSINIYCEQPYTSPDGRRVAILRYNDPNFDDAGMLLVSDVVSLKLALVERRVAGVCNAAWSGQLYYWVPDPAGNRCVRVSLTTLEQETVFVDDGKSCPKMPAGGGGSSVSPDHRYMIYMAPMELGGRQTCAIIRIDLKEKSWKVIFDHPEIVNPHLQFNPVHGKQILVQHNRGSMISADGTTVPSPDADKKLGTTLFTIDSDGSNQKPLPVGEPHSASSTGHECFIADTGMVAFTVGWNNPPHGFDPRHPLGNILYATPGDKKPTVFATPEHHFNHICVSRCGKYWLCDSYHLGLPGPVPLVIGNFKTGRFRTLLQDCGALCGGAQFTHPHAYFTADTKRVIYNGTMAFGAGHQVMAAQIPDGFLESLG
ncbi:MAG: hypothetical protein K8S99_09130 [Planctomycetes bacterium]|nr:hypothetical protein [Planctomycetota bacterium]